MQRQPIGREAHVEIDRLDNYLQVSLTGRIDSRFAARTFQEFVGSAARGFVARALFDYRDADDSGIDVERANLLWMQRTFDRAAILMSAVDRAEMLKARSFGEGAKIRHFEDRGAAANWLVTSDSWPSVNILVFEDNGVFYGMPADQVEEVVSAGEVLQAPGLPQAALGITELHGRIMIVVPPEIGADGSNSSNARFVVLRAEEGLLALLAERTHLLGRVAMEDEPSHGSVLDSDVGPLLCLDANALSAALAVPLPS